MTLAYMDQTWWIPKENERPCPGQCDPAYAMEAGYWSCDCGCWEMVEKAPRNLLPRNKAWLYGTTWEEVFGSAYDGQRLWGDIWQEEEDAAIARLSTEQRLARQAAVVAEAAALADRMARGAALEEISKAKSMVCGRDGKLRVPLTMRMCRDALAKACIDKKGRRWEAGCELHRNGCCKFVHPDQPEWEQLVQGPPAGADRFAALKSKPQQKQSRW